MAAKQLDGHPGDRIGDVRTNLGMTKKELSQKTRIDASLIARIENGNLKTISSDYLIKLTKELKTSTDYILSLTPVSVPKSYDISQLGLSEEAVKRLITKKIDASVLNRLLEHKDFPELCVLMKNYFDNTVASGIMARNQVIDFATEPLVELMSAEPSKRAEIIKDMSFLNSTKIQNNEADVEKIKNILMKIIREIKEDVTAQQPTGAIATAEAVNAIRDSLPDKPQSELTIDDVSTAVATYVGTMLPMDENTSALLQQLAKQMLETPMEGKE